MAIDCSEDNNDANKVWDGDAGGNNAPNLRQPAQPPTQLPAGGGADALGGGDDPNGGDNDEEEEDSNESSLNPNTFDDSVPEDPERGTGKFYKAQTPNGKEMVKMFKKLCDLNDRDVNVIVVYFGIYSEGRLAEFLHKWKDTFIQWQKHHPNQDGT